MNQEHGLNQVAPFVAKTWQLKSAANFLEWATSSGESQRRASTFDRAIRQVWQQHLGEAPSGQIARMLHDVLRSCDSLTFSESPEAIAYAGLHLLDRYGRVMQALKYLLQIGALPVRKYRVSVLEVGAGPAPALYASRDFYAMLHQWPGRGEIEVATVGAAESLERGRAWDRTLHHLSEQLMALRDGDASFGDLPFRRAIEDLSGFNAKNRHHKAIAQRAQSIVSEFDLADEYISNGAAFQLAYSEGVHEPSAYDLIFICNFLTQAEMTQRFSSELEGLAKSLTPGGVLVVMGGVGRQYPSIYLQVRQLAANANLTEVGPDEKFDPNGSAIHSLIRDHVIANVNDALAACEPSLAIEVRAKLPADLVDESKQFKLPKYQVLAFVDRSTTSRSTAKGQGQRPSGDGS